MTKMSACAIALLCSPAPALAADGGVAKAPCRVAASASVLSASVLPGQPVDIAFHLKNIAGSDLSLELPSETVGTVQLRISNEGDPKPRQYLGPGWGTEDSVMPKKPLPKDASFDLSLRVLYQVREPPYAFAKPGTYSLRLSYAHEGVCPDGTVAPTLTIKVADPKGPDLAVWNAIKDCKRCAHLLHTGHPGKNQAGRDAVELLRSVANQYPTSAYTALIRARLEGVGETAKAPAADRAD